jgi:hypothetical protein
MIKMIKTRMPVMSANAMMKVIAQVIMSEVTL